MNYKMLFYTLGRIFKVIGLVMILPIIIALCYGDPLSDLLAFVYTMAILLGLGFALSFKAPKNKTIYAKEGIVTVGLSWIFISLLGMLPFMFSGDIPNFFDAFFETSSGFTTTGTSILTPAMMASMGKSIQFWRCFTHWIGGMGILIFILAVLPNSGASSFQLVRSESTGAQVSKLVSKVRLTAQILYLIYTAMSIILCIFLLAGGMDFFNSMVVTFSTAGTGGFSVLANSIEGYNSLYVNIVVTVFMFLFGVNFNIYYLVLIGKFRQAIRSEELRTYIIIAVVAVLLIAWNLVSVFGNFATALEHASFQAISAISSTGFISTDVNVFPAFSQGVIMLLMFSGACAGSTSGGFKVSRVVILAKSTFAKCRSQLNPRHTQIVKLDGKRLEDNIIHETNSFFALYVAIIFATYLVLAAGGIDLLTGLSVSISSISNIGISFTPLANPIPPSSFPWYCKLALSFEMLIGRLELFPILMLFNRHTWSRIN